MIKVSGITKNKDEILRANVLPDVIKNRFDKLHPMVENRGGGYNLYCVDDGTAQVYIPAFINGNSCSLAVYLRKIDKRIFQKFIDYLFQRHKNLQIVNVLHTLTEIDDIPLGVHWHIDLPETIEDFDKTLSAKVRQHSRYYVKKITKEVGGPSFKKLERSQITQKIADIYLNWKKDSHAFEYDRERYLTDFCVSNAYLLEIKDEIIAIGFDVETGTENVYFENFSYNPLYAQYSVGMMLYHKIIEDWIKNKKKRAYLLGGNYEYKKNYNGICTMTRSGNIYRHPRLAGICRYLAEKLNKTGLSQSSKKTIVKIIKPFLIFKFYKKMLKNGVVNS